MKTLNLVEMQNVEAGANGSGTAFACTLTVIASAAFIIGTAGTGAVVAAYASGAVCGGSIGWGLASGNWW